MMQILIAEDHPIMRKGLRQVLSAEPGWQVDEVSTIPELRDYLTKLVPDILLLDVTMPGGSGLEMLGEIRQGYPGLAVLVVSAHREDRVGLQAVIAGARGFLSKESAAENLVEAVRRLLKGGRFVSPELSEALAEYVQGQNYGSAEPHQSLSARELTVLRMITAGTSTGEIASSLHVSPKSVSTYRARILEKMRMKTNAQLVRYVIEHNLEEQL